MKTIAKTLLLVLAFAGIGYWAWGKFTGPGDTTVSTSGKPAATTAVASPSTAPVVVTYFSSDVRCPTCLEIEALTRRAVEERFSGPLAEGQVAFQILNMDEKENTHFVDDYELAFKTVVIRGDAHQSGEDAKGRSEVAEPWVKMDGVWSLTAKPEEFIDYIAAEVTRRLPEAD